MDLAIRTFVIFWFIFLLMRIAGRRELSSLEPFDLILLIVVGDSVQQGITQDDYSVTGALVVVSVFSVLQVGVSYLNFRFPRLRPVLDGNPLVLVEDGKLIAKNLRRERITEDDLLEEARGHQIESLSKVKWAVLETSGTISFIEQSSS
jgi:uncharacterized membrane protein YcaP (DUF421 family)